MNVNSTAQAARYAALAILILCVGIQIAIVCLGLHPWDWTSAILPAITLALLTYFIVYYLIGQLLSRRLGVIYKLIRNNSLDTPEGFEDSSPDEKLAQTEKEVKSWSVQRLSNREKEEILKKYRQDFTGNISHELKTPLFSIEGYVHTLLDGAMNDPVMTKKYLKKAADNVDRLTEIIDAMSTISKFESGQLDLDIREFDIRELVEECIEELRFQLEEKKSEVINTGDQYSKVMVYGDRQYIRQVLINLLSNSIRYGEKKGTTNVGYSLIGDQYLIEVSDQGIGIEAEHLPHVFDRFYRVDYGRSRKEGGSGIGLAIVKHIINAHGQRVQVSSEYGKGSNFSFTLKKV